MLDPLVRTYIRIKSREEGIADYADDLAAAYIIRSIEILGDRHPQIVQNCHDLLQGQDFMDVAVSGSARRIMALHDKPAKPNKEPP